jgi:hypothetical protein
MPSDTHPAAARVQLDLLRAAGFERRATIARSLSRSVIGLSRRALRERMPEAAERELQLRWVELHYGRDLAVRVRAFLARRSS